MATDPISALVSGKFDFALLSQGDLSVIAAQARGIKLNIFPLVHYCIPDDYGLDLISNEHLVAQQPDLVRRFVQATAQGYTFAAQHPHEAASLLVQGAPKGSFDNPTVVLTSQGSLSQEYMQGTPCWGTQTATMWKTYGQWMHAHQLLVDASGKPLTNPPDATSAFTNRFLPTCPS